jgi:phospho-N-acetylmuramoyl-pentapeptide-transferase
MGGLIFISGGLLIPLIIMALPSGGYHKNTCFLATLCLVLAYAAIGLVDDYLTIRPIKGVRGIASKPKAAIQFVVAVLFVVWLAMSRPADQNVLMVGHFKLLSGIPYYIFAVLFITGMANFVNISDGLDGLVSGLTMVLCIIFGLILLRSDSNHGLLMFGLAGSLLGFLWYNTNPARVFMGDTGSLAIGAFLPAIALLSHMEMFLIIAGGVFILDGLSTAVQWAVFKYTRIKTGTGTRVFLKSPVHHHFELCGYPEQTVVVRFWIAGVVAGILGIVYVWCFQ